MKLILASGSPRRKEIIERLGIPFEVCLSDFDESSVKAADPIQFVKEAALGKARDVAKKKRMEGKMTEGTVLGADTTVYCDGNIINKPKSRENAASMLKMLSGKTHSVFTGIALVDIKTKKEIVDYDEAKVTFRKISSKEITSFLDSSAPYLGYAGSYTIQHPICAAWAKVEGDTETVVGLPSKKLMLMLKGFS